MNEIEESKQNTHPRHQKRFVRIVLLIAAIILLILSAFIVLNRSQVVRPASNSNTSVTPSETPIYLDTPPAQAEFYDTFINNAQNWSVSSTSGYFRMIGQGGLTLTNTNRDTTLIESLPTNSLFANCTITVDLTTLKAGSNDSVGIYIRGDTNLEHDYRIDVYGNGYVDIVKEYLDSKNNPQAVVLTQARISSILKPQGNQNTITVTMNGPQIRLYINNTRTGSVTDSDYTSGQVALFAHLDNSSPEIKVLFSRVEIDKIGGTLTTG